MDVKHRLALKHESGRYLSWSPDNFPLTPKLSQARRFLNIEELRIFLESSPYAPDKPEEYEIVSIKITYEEEDFHVDSESGTEKSKVALGD